MELRFPEKDVQTLVTENREFRADANRLLRDLGRDSRPSGRTIGEFNFAGQP